MAHSLFFSISFYHVRLRMSCPFSSYILHYPNLFQIHIPIRMPPEIDLAAFYRLFFKHPAHIFSHNLMFLGSKTDGSAPFCHF